MLEKAIDIVKARWPEVALLVGLQAAMMVLSEHMVRISQLSELQNAPLPLGASFLLGLGVVAYAIIWQMMHLGFLKTAALEEGRARLPMELVRCGRPYFWRIFVFQLIAGFIVMLISNVLVLAMTWLIRRPQLPQWLIQVCTFWATLIMIKPILIVTARIIVYDSPVWLSLRAVFVYALGYMDGLVEFLASGASILMLTMLIGNFVPEKTVAYYLYSGVHNIVFSLFFLILTLTAVLWLETVRRSETDHGDKDH